ncbi:glycosyltransferase family 2 protein [Oscillospiraceae bacterium Marseille-Q3528]|nr:glycosyltransferase family 2 protein [Oscillospiraceae bacterium Marseille-Q3528]
MDEQKGDLTAYYKELYDCECEKNDELVAQLEEAEKHIEELDYKLGRIKNSFAWKLSKPLRGVMHTCVRVRDVYRQYGSPVGVARKVRLKMRQKNAQKQHGLASFPNAEERKRQEETVFPKDITFSILVPLYNTPEKFLREMIDSVQAQTYRKWELCLADGSDDAHPEVGRICQEYMQNDSRIKYKKIEKNLGISGNTNVCFGMATGEYIGLFDHDDLLHPSVLYEYMRAICEQDADYIYCDEVTFEGNSIDNMLTIHFKPDFSIDNLRANNYICHFSVFSEKLLEETGLFRSEFDGSQDHDMILRLTSRAKKIVHVPKILYYWRSHPQSVAADINAKTYAIDAAKRAVLAHLKSCGLEGTVESTRAFPTIFRIKYKLKAKPMISIIIPNKDHRDDLKRCVDSILNKSTYENYEILIVENNSTEAETFAYYKMLENQPKVRVITYEAEGSFNYSKINNFAAKQAKGEYLLLLNNDTKVITREWMEELLMYAQRDDVGAVGAKLYYADNTIQHAGIVIGLGAHHAAGHTHHLLPKENLGYMGRLCYAQDVTAVTGACLLVRKSLYEQVGGLDESFTVALNDVDFCLRLRALGLLNIFTPFAELYHYESKSRGLDKDGASAERYNKEVAHFRERWKKELDAGDPYFNPNFSLEHATYELKV